MTNRDRSKPDSKNHSRRVPANPKMKQAQAYARSGFAVLPIYEPTVDGCACGNRNCSHVGKHPRSLNGVKDATTDLNIIDGWWTRWPRANIGIATGAVSNLTVVDLDGEDALEAYFRISGLTALPPKATIGTGRGYHVYYRPDDLVIGNSAGKLAPGVDVRGEGGYVIAHGSRHASGVMYRLMGWSMLRRTIVPEPVSDWLAALARAPNAERAATAAEPIRDAANYGAAALSGELAKLLAAPGHTRNNTLNACAFSATDTSNQSGIVYNLGPGDHVPVNAYDDDPMTAIWDAGDGNEKFTIQSGGWVSDATLKLTNLTPADLSFGETVDGDLVITNLATGKTMTIANQFNNAWLGVYQIVFDDGTTMSQAQIQAAAYVYGQPGSPADTYDTSNRGTVNYDLGPGDHGVTDVTDVSSTIVKWAAADGNEEFNINPPGYTALATLDLTDLTLADVSLGETVGGDLVITNLATGKTLEADQQFDDSYHGFASITFADGTTLTRDQIQADATIYGSPGSVADAYDTSNRANVTYDLGPGDHGVVSAYHDDSSNQPLTVVWDAGDGNESFTIEGNNYTNDATLQLTNLTLSDLQFAEDTSGNLILTNLATGKTLTINNQFNNAWQGVATIALADGTTLDQAQIQALAPIRGTPGSAADAYDTSNRANVTYDLGPGDHGVVSAYHDDSSNQPLTVVWDAGDGNESFTIEGNNYTNDATLQLTNLTLSDLQFGKDASGDLILTNVNTGKTLTINNQFNNTWQGVQQIELDDGTILSSAQIQTAAMIGTLSGSSYTPPAGSDSLPISGAPGSYDFDGTLDDSERTINFAPGVDSAVTVDVNDYGTRGTSQEQQFRYSSADGNVWIRDTSGAAADAFVFTDIASSDVTFSRSYSDSESDDTGYSLTMTVASTGKTITLDNYLKNDVPYGPAVFAFSDGVVLSKAQVEALADPTTPLPAQISFDGAYTTTNLATQFGDLYRDAGSGEVYRVN